MFSRRLSYMLIGLLVAIGVTIPFNPLLNGPGAASFIYYVFHCVVGILLLAVITNRKLDRRQDA